MHRRLKLLVLVTLLAHLAIGNAFGAERSEPVNRLITQAITSEEKMDQASVRSTLVRNVAAYCSEVDRSFPRNSPADEAWLNSEMRGDSNRVIRALGSSQRGRQKARTFVTECQSFANMYLSGNLGDKRVSMIGLALAFSRFDDDAKIYGDQNGVDGKKLGFELLSPVTDSLIYAAFMEAMTSDQSRK